MSVGEFELIERFFHRALPERSDVLIGIGDDGALLKVPSGQSLVTATATLSTADWDESSGDPVKLGRKLMTVAMTRLAAAGVQARWVTLALTLPEAREPWLAAFSDALFQVTVPLGVALIGGDTTRGPFTATIVGHGLLDRAVVQTKPQCRAGDVLCVSGRLDAGARGQTAADGRIPVALGQWIRARGGVAEDISEGLGAAVRSLLQPHALGATVELSQLPVAAKLRCQLEANNGWLELLGHRNDTQLCFTLPPGTDAAPGTPAAQEDKQGNHGRWTRVGSVNNSGILQCAAADGRLFTAPADLRAGLAK
jgi:thiamine-monophosphate kinase